MKPTSIVDRVNNYIGDKDWKVKENSNTSRSFANLQGYLVNQDLTEYGLKEVYTGELSQAHEDCIIHIHDMSHPIVGYCFTGDTRVKLINGTVKTLKEMAESDEKEFWVYSKDENGFTVPGHAINARKTRENANLVRVVLDNHEEIRCTPDHKFMMNDGSYKEAIDLVSGDSLKPGYFLTTFNGYLGVSARTYDSNSYKAFHRVVMEHKIGRPLQDGETVHHIDGNKYNNYPDNLQLMTDSEHRAMELRKTMSTDKWKIANANRLAEFNSSDYMREASARRLSNRNKSDYQKACCSYSSTKGYDKSDDLKDNYLSYVDNNGFIKFSEYMNMISPVNHKVLFVEVLEYTEDVYDIEVEKYHNFLLDAGVYVHNCAGWGIKQIVHEGFNCGSTHVHSTPPHHLRSLFGQINNFIFTMSGEWAGAQALNSIDTYCAAYIKYDKMSYEEVYKEIRSLIYNLNIKTRIAMQSPFTNFSVDITVPDDLKHEKAYVGDIETDFTYGDCQDEMDLFNKALCDVMMEGDAIHNIFTFPIITYGITDEFPWDSELAEKVFTFADESNSPYFSNFINSDNDPSDVRSMCCRLRLDMRELEKSSGGLFGSGDSTGSIGVVTLNLSRIGYMARVLADFYGEPDQIWNRKVVIKDGYETKETVEVHTEAEVNKVLDILSHYPELFARINIELRKKTNQTKIFIYTMMIRYFMDIGRKSLLIKRQEVQDSMDGGMIPYTKRYLGTFDNHFNTIGVNAGHEMCLNMLDKGIDTEDGKNLAMYTLDFMLNKLSDYQEEDNGKLLWNLEATPAEGCGTRFSKGDRKDFKGIVTGGGTNMEFYTNSTQLPDSYTDNIYEAFDHQEDLQVKYTSGTVQHIYMDEPVHNWKVVQSLVRKLFTNYKIPYISISPNICVCPICGRLIHNKEWCEGPHDPEKVKELIRTGVLSEDDVLWNEE